MMSHETRLRLSDPILRAACDLAAARGVSLAQVIRDALAAELRRARGNVPPPVAAPDYAQRPTRSPYFLNDAVGGPVFMSGPRQSGTEDVIGF
jgi:hypothetical protein